MQLPETDPLIAVFNEILRVHGRFRAVFRPVERATGLPAMELSVLASVAEARMPPTVSQMGRSLGHARQVIQRAANELIRLGHVEARPNPADRRAPVLVLTEQGRAAKAQADAEASRVVAGLRGEIDRTYCEALAADLRQIRQAMDRWLAERPASD